MQAKTAICLGERKARACECARAGVGGCVSGLLREERRRRGRAAGG